MNEVINLLYHFFYNISSGNWSFEESLPLHLGTINLCQKHLVLLSFCTMMFYFLNLQSPKKAFNISN